MFSETWTDLMKEKKTVKYQTVCCTAFLISWRQMDINGISTHTQIEIITSKKPYKNMIPVQNIFYLSVF